MTDPAVAEIRAELATVYHPEGVDIWMAARQERFGGRTALECIEQGDAEMVSQAVDQLVTGSFI